MARIAFYMELVYNNYATVSTPDLLLDVELSESNKNVFANKDTLLYWHCKDPVSSYELTRNKVISLFQGNVNAFVQWPKLAEKISDKSCKEISKPLASHMNNSNCGTLKINVRYSCDELTSGQAQLALYNGHTYLDSDGDGFACERPVRLSRLSCTELTSNEAQLALAEGHVYLDSDKDGIACELEKTHVPRPKPKIVNKPQVVRELAVTTYGVITVKMEVMFVLILDADSACHIIKYLIN